MNQHLLETDKASMTPNTSENTGAVSRESDVAEKDEGSESLFDEHFLGYVDKVDPGSISGWILDKKNPSSTVTVMLIINGRYGARVFANQYRQDVHEAGHAEGNCGFEFDLTTNEFLDFELCDADLVVEVVSDENLAVMHSGRMPSALESLSEVCKKELVAAFSLLDHPVANNGNSKETSAEFSSSRFSNGVIKSLYRSGELESTNTRSKDVPTLSPYVIFTRDRLNKHKTYEFENNPRVAIDLLIWYLEEYSFNRQPYRVPLSDEEINYCNELMVFPGAIYSFSRLHYFMLLKYKPDLNIIATLNSEEAFCAEIYEWVEGTCARLNIGDICVPAEYVDKLSSVPGFWAGLEFPLSRYYELKWSNPVECRSFDLSKPKHRGCLYLMTILGGMKNISNVRFLPDEVKRDVFSSEKLLGELDLHVLEPACSGGLDIECFENSLVAQLSENGIDFYSGDCLSRTDYGDRHHFANPHCNRLKSGLCDVQLIGPLDKASGLGQATRLSAAVLKKLPYSLNLVNFDMDNPAPSGFSTSVAHGKLSKAKVNLIHLNAESIPMVMAYSADVFSDSYNIGYFFWELDSPARCHSLALEMLDEVWVCTEYGVSQYKEHCDIPVVNVGMSYESQDVPDKSVCKDYLNEKFGINNKTTVYLSTFDSYSFVQRKNPLAVIEAFKECFQGEEDVQLLLKTQNKTLVGDPEQLKIWRGIEYAIDGDSRIRLINRTFNYDELLKFKKAADCYVSLHRSEGWGFGMIEAMTLGVPVIATNYSGNLEFCKSDNCWLIDASDRYLAENDYIFVTPGQKWAEPDISHAKDAMRECFEKSEERIRKSDSAERFTASHFSTSAISARYRNRLEEIFEGL